MKIKTAAIYPTPEIEELGHAFLKLKNKKETINFLRDLLTIAEITEFANRWQMVKLLIEGKPYLEIAKKLNTSTTTVTRVAQWLKNGTGGYQTIAARSFKKK